MFQKPVPPKVNASEAKLTSANLKLKAVKVKRDKKERVDDDAQSV